MHLSNHNLQRGRISYLNQVKLCVNRGCFIKLCMQVFIVRCRRCFIKIFVQSFPLRIRKFTMLLFFIICQVRQIDTQV